MRRAGFAFFLLAAAATASAWNRPAQSRIVAVADVHGGFEPFVSILTTAGLIDSQRRWSGGNAIFVQTGDITIGAPVSAKRSTC